MNDKISVIVPIYKVEKYLKRCVDSIINQTYKNLEIILVDDGSPDNCGRICDEYAKTDDRIRVIHKENGGLSDARNAGIDIASGEYLSFIDSDDWVDENFINLLYKNIVENDADIAITGITCVYDDKSEDMYIPAQGCINNIRALELLNETGYVYMVVACNKLYKKKMFDNIRYPKGRINEDELVIHKIFYEADKICLLTDKNYYYYQRTDSIMGNLRTKDNEVSLNKYFILSERSMFYKEKELKSVLYKNNKNRIGYIIYFLEIHLKGIWELSDEVFAAFLQSDVRRLKYVMSKNPKHILYKLLFIFYPKYFMKKGRKNEAKD